MKRLLLILLLMATSTFASSEQAILDGYVKKWAPRFHMEAWTITIQAVPIPVLTSYTGNFVMGVSRWDPFHRTGYIAIASLDSYSKYILEVGDVKSAKLDQENTVVHEMIHNVWQHMTNEEAAVQLISELVVPEHRITLWDKIVKHKAYKEPDVTDIMEKITKHESVPTIFDFSNPIVIDPQPTSPAPPEN